MDEELLDDDLLLDSLRRVAARAPDEGTAERSAEPVLARYRVLRRLGEGGMGIVYEAEQEAPRRTVALKVLRPGAATKRLLRRFEYEAEVLARLDHPGIAKVLEAGSYDAGEGPQPWFAMELIRGERLSDYLAKEPLELHAKLDLFVRICDAVHHAHQKGIVHRDLKPANILIDERGLPKVVDFGVARATDPQAGTTTQKTLAGQLVGTLPYMSPEQVSGDPDAVDIRSDVYALGALLYEMLAGRRPIDVSGLSLTDAARAIEDSEPARLGALVHALRGDLEIIVAKALEKERERRYASAAALADDVGRHLQHEPIAARPPSGLYQLRKFARRNRTLVGAVVAVFLALGAGIVATRVQVIRARAAERNLRDALKQAEAANAASGFLQLVLEQADPSATAGDDPTIRDVLEEAARRVQDELTDDPLVEAQVRASLGRAYLGLDDADASRGHLERALVLSETAYGANHPKVASVLVTLVELAVDQNRFDEADAYAARVVEMAERGDATEHDRAACLWAQGRASYQRGRFETAERLIAPAIEIFARDPEANATDLARAKASQALVYFALDDGEGALALLRDSLTVLRSTRSAANPHTANTLDLLASTLLRRAEVDEAEELAKEAHRIRRERYGDEHAATALSVRTLGLVAFARRDLATAEERLRQSLDVMRRSAGDRNAQTAQCELLVGQVLLEKGDLEGAEERLGAAIDASPDPTSVIVGSAWRMLGTIAAKSDRPAEALEAFERSAWILTERFSPEHDHVIALRTEVGRYLTAWGRYEDAEAQLVPTYEQLVATKGTGLALTSRLRLAIVDLYDAWGMPDMADEFRKP